MYTKIDEHIIPFKGSDGKYHYLYKIINRVNEHYYIGVHSTNNLNDNYSGSGLVLKNAIKKYGIEQFTKIILKFFNTSKEKFDEEAKIITERFLNDPNCYNINYGGYGGSNAALKGKMPVTDKITGEHLIIPVEKFDKEQYISTSEGKIAVIDKDGNKYFVDIEDERYLKGELRHISCGKANLINKETGYLEYVNVECLNDTHVSPFKNRSAPNKEKKCMFDLNGNQVYIENNNPDIGVKYFTYDEFKEKSGLIRARTPYGRIKIITLQEFNDKKDYYVDAFELPKKYKHKITNEVKRFRLNDYHLKEDPNWMEQIYVRDRTQNWRKLVIFPDDPKLKTGEYIRIPHSPN